MLFKRQIMPSGEMSKCNARMRTHWSAEMRRILLRDEISSSKLIKSAILNDNGCGFRSRNSSETTYSQHKCCLRLLSNLCGLKDGGCNWFEYPKGGLLSRGFKRYQTDPCLLIRGSLVLAMHLDDVMVAGKSKYEIESLL